MEPKKKTTRVARATSGNVSVSAIIKEMEEKGMVYESPRNIERKFKLFIEKLDGSCNEWKDENGSYSVPINQKAILQALIMEIVRDDGYVKKILKDKTDDLMPQDVVSFFNNIAEYTEGKVEEEVRIIFLMQLDADIRYEVWIHFANSLSMIASVMMNIEKWPYPHQVDAMKDLYTLVRDRWGNVIQEELSQAIKAREEIEEIINDE